MPQQFKQFQNPSFLDCTNFIQDSSPEIQFAAKYTMRSILKRMKDEEIKDLSKEMFGLLSHSKIEGKKKRDLVIAIAFLALKKPNLIEKNAAGMTAVNLIDIMDKGGSYHKTSINLLGEGYGIWKNYIYEPNVLVKKLFQLSYASLNKDKIKNLNEMTEDEKVSEIAVKAFIQISLSDIDLVIGFLSGLMKDVQTMPNVLNACIKAYLMIIKNRPQILEKHLPSIISCVMKVLNPQFPEVRDVCLNSAKDIFRNIVQIYPMVSFNQETQKLAVGNYDGILQIYDFRTGGIWQSFEAHKSGISIVEFAPNGLKIATFSPKDQLVSIWLVNTTSVLSIFGSSSKLLKTVTIPEAKPTPYADVLKSFKIDFKMEVDLILFGVTKNPLKLAVKTDN